MVVVWRVRDPSSSEGKVVVKGGKHQQKSNKLTGSLVTATMLGSAERAIAELAFVFLLGREC